MIPRSILSIQSHVAYGHVGNAAAVFPLQRLGFEVWPIMTVQFSNHTGYGAWTGEVFSASVIGDLIEGMKARPAFSACAALLTGYVGDASIGAAILKARAEVKAANPQALYLCDPVMGDVGRGVFVRPEIPAFMRERAVPAADVITPNQFELELLTGRAVRDLQDAVAAARLVLDLGPRLVLVTSLRHATTPADRIEMLAVTAAGAWAAGTPLLPLDPPPNGAGDAVAALFLGRLLLGDEPPQALARAAAGVYAIIEATFAAGSRELQLVAAQDRFATGEGAPVTRVA